jgi:hypothetical protein
VSNVTVFLFESSHFALWAEDVARERKVEVKVIPAPPQAEATCGLAIEIPGGDAEALQAAFEEEGISFRRL